MKKEKEKILTEDFISVEVLLFLQQHYIQCSIKTLNINSKLRMNANCYSGFE